MFHDASIFGSPRTNDAPFTPWDCDPTEALQRNEVCLAGQTQASSQDRRLISLFQKYDRLAPHCYRDGGIHNFPIYRWERVIRDGFLGQSTLYLIGQVHGIPSGTLTGDPERDILIRSRDTLNNLEAATYQMKIGNFLSDHRVRDIFDEGLGREIASSSCESMFASSGSLSDPQLRCERMRIAFIQLWGRSINQDPRVYWQVDYLSMLGAAIVYAMLSERANLHATENVVLERQIDELIDEARDHGQDFSDLLMIPEFRSYAFKARELAAVQSIMSFLGRSAREHRLPASAALVFGNAHRGNLEVELDETLQRSGLPIRFVGVWWEGISEMRR